jgi:hypothetical protein
MRSHPVWARGTSVRWQVWLITVALCLFGAPVEGEAGDLKDTISSLWPGGIRLQPPTAGFSHEPHFLAASLQGLDTLNTSLASSLGFLSLNSSTSGFTFDIERGVPVRTTDSLGPLLAERAPTLGKGKLDVALTYTRIEFSRFQGKRLNKLKLDFQHEDTNRNGIKDTTGIFSFESDVVEATIDLSIEEDVWALFGTYGITRNWDVGIVVPIIHIRLRAVGDATIIRNSPVSQVVHNFGPDSSPSHVSGGGDKTGVGDILLRTKYNFLRNQGAWPDLAVLGQVKLPSGDPDNLLGTGHTNFLPMLVASKTYGFFTPHVNAGYELTTGPREDDNLRYIVGFDTRLHPRVTFATDLLGRWEPNRNGNGSHIVDLAFGLKWNPVGSFLVGGYAQVPLNRNEGLRANVIWSLAAEYIF